MGGRNAILLFLLALVLLGSPASAVKKPNCYENTSGSPLCVAPLCKATCWIAGQMFHARVLEHKCVGSILKSSCYCYLCDK
ncbi:hypothetical protein BRADI_4g40903v3 [Brachypodium distachyon]|uniref:Knottin scorpion toxin-like domain-containing protein n=1 Tax=Brachypodium distachyon TaxID=15368 RepID=A0A0Q3PR34_BRADI|nr:hypothetical protein BRADI_4g40903v3 [Brachypodium distachyon]